MKKILIFIFIAALSLYTAACSGSKDSNSSSDTIIKIGFAGESDYQIWNPIADRLAEENIILELVSFSDYGIPNQALHEGEIDLNAFQHYAYFNEEVSEKRYDITAIADTYISAMNIYSANIQVLKR